MEKIINNLLKSKIGIFCGAGISFNSGVPIVSQIIKEFLIKFNVEESDIVKILEKQFPFEGFIESFIMNEEELNLFIKIFDCGEPNTTHFLLAELAKQNVVKEICTTNFDTLIEKALSNKGVKFKVYKNEDDFEKIIYEDGVLNIYKIHGCVSEPLSIRTTIKKIASKNLSRKRLFVLKQLFQNKITNKILYLGYSCSDTFDITPQLLTLISDKEINFIEHNRELLKIEDLKNKLIKNPFKSLTGYRIHCDTDEFVRLVYERFETNIRIVRTKTNWKEILIESLELLKKNDFNNRLLSFLSNYLGDAILTEKYLRKAKANNSEPNTKFQYLFHSVCVNNHKGNLELSFNYLQKIDRLLDEKKSSLIRLNQKRVNYYYLIANHYFTMGKYDLAIYYCKLGIDVISSNSNEDFTFYKNSIFLTYANSLLFNQQYHESICIQIKQIRTARNEGDILAEAGQTIGLANNLIRQNKFLIANIFLTFALELSKEIGNIELISVCLNSQAIIYNLSGDYNNCLNILNQTLHYNRLNNDKLGETITLGNIADTQMSIGNYKEGQIFNQQALSISRQIQDLQGILSCNLREVAIYIDFFRDYSFAFEIAIKCLNEINKKETKTGTLGNIRDLYYNLGICCLHLKKIENGLVYLKNALEFDINTKNEEQIKLDLALMNRLEKERTPNKVLPKAGLK